MAGGVLDFWLDGDNADWKVHAHEPAAGDVHAYRCATSFSKHFAAVGKSTERATASACQPEQQLHLAFMRPASRWTQAYASRSASVQGITLGSNPKAGERREGRSPTGPGQ